MQQYFLKGDISGIQDFIFNVKSEGASKTLKARSFFIQALSDVCISIINESKDLVTDVEKFYNGGGNFYLFCNLKGEMKAVKEILQQKISYYFLEEDIYVAISIVKNEGEVWDNINSASNLDKLKKYQNLYSKTFQPFPKKIDYD